MTTNNIMIGAVGVLAIGAAAYMVIPGTSNNVEEVAVEEALDTPSVTTDSFDQATTSLDIDESRDSNDGAQNTSITIPQCLYVQGKVVDSEVIHPLQLCVGLVEKAPEDIEEGGGKWDYKFNLNVLDTVNLADSLTKPSTDEIVVKEIPEPELEE